MEPTRLLAAFAKDQRQVDDGIAALVKTRSPSRPAFGTRYLRKAKSVEELLRWLYLKGVSTGDLTEALAALLAPKPLPHDDGDPDGSVLA